MTALLEVKGIEIKYHTREGILTALRDVNFDIQGGEILGIVGESGCGKSTIASAVMRLLPPNGEITRGSMLFNGRDLTKLDDESLRKIRGRQISMIFQDPMTSLNPVFNIETQMVDALRAHGSNGNRQALRKRAIQMLDRVGIPDAARRIKDYPHQFSGGMRQRIMIASALLSNPSLLVADEPTSALDVTLEAQIIDLIRGLREELGTAILYITHDLGVVAQLCDRVIVMYAGSIVESGDVHGIFEAPKHPYTRALLRSHPSRSHRVHRLTTIPGRVPSLRDLPPGCKFAPRCQRAQSLCHAVEPKPLKVGSQYILCHTYDPDWTAPEESEVVLNDSVQKTEPVAEVGRSDKVVVATKDLRLHFADEIPLLGQVIGQKGGAVRAVDGVDIEIRRGETLALVGESGSGKTTLGRVVLRLEEPTSGGVFVDGRDISRLRQAALRPMRKQMQMIFQDPASSLSPRMKVADLLLEPFRIHKVPLENLQEKVDDLLAMVGLSSEQADKYPHQLSGGQARRVGIARALALNPELLVADEPTAGLDVSVAAGILNLMKDLGERLDLTYLVITHNLNIISFIADRVAVMYLGKVVELARTDDLFDNTRHPYSEALMSAISLPDPKLRDNTKRIILSGEIPSPRNPPSGCAFHPRCRYAEAKCAQVEPLLREIGAEHQTACHFPERVGSILATS